MSPLPAALPLPALDFGEDGVLRSVTFGDVYASREGGAEETCHVFLSGNDLPTRWQKRERFTIGELGFGTGLNFLVTWREFLQQAPKSHRLHHISFEQFPLTPDMLRSIHGDDALAQQLIARYPLRLPGIHRVEFERVTLTLCFGDARALLPQLAGAHVDAWYLDGFSPAKNPELWGGDIFAAIAAASAPDATAATYSAAGIVRTGLAAAGFVPEKRQGFGHKKDMLVGRRSASHPGLAPGSDRAKRGFGPGVAARTGMTVVVGGGIAGCTAARALAERGHEVTLLEKHILASGASGNEAAVLYPPITKTWLPRMEWYFTGYGFTLRQLARWREMGLIFAGTSPGMAKLPSSAEDAVRLAGVNAALGIDPAIVEWLEKDALSQRIGMHVDRGGVWYTEGTWLSPVELCRALLQHPRITLREECEAASLLRVSDGWRVTTATGETVDAAQVVLCAATEAKKFLPQLRIGMSAGQVTLVPAEAAWEKLTTIVCHKGYIVPQYGQYLLGATYDHADFSGAVTQENHARNLEAAQAALPEWLREPAVSGGRTSLRATTPDRMPMIGEVEPGLYVSTGHGSRGMISAPLAAEMIASHIEGEALPVTQTLANIVSPLRQAAIATVAANPSRAKMGA